MGQVTPNMGIYIPAAGETNYDAPFAAGMINIDQHDHSGAPNKGVPIATSGIADGSITYNKLNANVVTAGSGLTTQTGSLANQITTTGLLNALALLATNGILANNGSAIATRTITGTTAQIAVANGSGVSGNPTISLDPAFYSLGTFTPGIAFGGASVGVTYVAQQGLYVQIGSLVFFAIVIHTSSVGSSTGAATITGFPIATGTNGGEMSCLAQVSNITFPASYTNMGLQFNTSSTIASLIVTGSGQSLGAATTSNTTFANNLSIFVSGVYSTQ